MTAILSPDRMYTRDEAANALSTIGYPCTAGVLGHACQPWRWALLSPVWKTGDLPWFGPCDLG